MDANNENNVDDLLSGIDSFSVSEIFNGLDESFGNDEDEDNVNTDPAETSDSAYGSGLDSSYGTNEGGSAYADGSAYSGGSAYTDTSAYSDISAYTDGAGADSSISISDGAFADSAVDAGSGYEFDFSSVGSKSAYGEDTNDYSSGGYMDDTLSGSSAYSDNVSGSAYTDNSYGSNAGSAYGSLNSDSAYGSSSSNSAYGGDSSIETYVPGKSKEANNTPSSYGEDDVIKVVKPGESVGKKKDELLFSEYNDPFNLDDDSDKPQIRISGDTFKRESLNKTTDPDSSLYSNNPYADDALNVNNNPYSNGEKKKEEEDLGLRYNNSNSSDGLYKGGSVYTFGKIADSQKGLLRIFGIICIAAIIGMFVTGYLGYTKTISDAKNTLEKASKTKLSNSYYTIDFKSDEEARKWEVIPASIITYADGKMFTKHINEDSLLMLKLKGKSDTFITITVDDKEYGDKENKEVLEDMGISSSEIIENASNTDDNGLTVYAAMGLDSNYYNRCHFIVTKTMNDKTVIIRTGKSLSVESIQNDIVPVISSIKMTDEGVK